MDYKPHYLQPFTPSEAIALDVSVITQGWHFHSIWSPISWSVQRLEIVRLQNSLEHLRQTQEGLREYLASESLEDPEIAKALEENELVMFVSLTLHTLSSASGSSLTHSIQRLTRRTNFDPENGVDGERCTCWQSLRQV